MPEVEAILNEFENRRKPKPLPPAPPAAPVEPGSASDKPVGYTELQQAADFVDNVPEYAVRAEQDKELNKARTKAQLEWDKVRKWFGSKGAEECQQVDGRKCGLIREFQGAQGRARRKARRTMGP